MTRKQENMILEMIEELTVLENRLGGWRGELKKLLAKEITPRRNPKKKVITEATVLEGIRRRAIRKSLRKSLNL